MPARWVLIPQIEHAHLAGKLAEHWGAAPLVPLRPRTEVLWAVFHHDDGWRAWDFAPDVDPQSGKPRAFTEMEIDTSVAIWSASIEEASTAGNLQAYLVAGHFCALAERAAAWKHGDTAWARAEQFIQDYRRQMRIWLADWQAASQATNTVAVADQALCHLQFFDSLSLWFCCAPASGPETVETPGGPELGLFPDDSQILLDPWPFQTPELNLEVPGREVPAGRYASREALALAPSQPVQLTWRLRPTA